MNKKVLFSKSTLIILLVSFLSFQNIKGQEAPETFTNPILTGYHPDPSICRVGDDYYMVTSTFVWFPGIPIYHSKDLVNWKLIGHGIHRPEQLSFEGLADRNGVYAVTIRHHEGTFYLITTCVGCGGNFYLTAKDPAGPWSDPNWIKDAPGIDPSLMWNDDGKCYYTGHNGIHKKYQGQCEIWNQELDLVQKKLVGKRQHLTYGHANNASYTEGPHLYKINGKYLLLVSEGGTGLYHALSVHHSDSLWGPYVTNMINPVITHRHFGVDYPIHAIGHGDLVQTQNGEWWCVTLGKRMLEGKTLLARETFLSKVEFDGKTPVFNRGYGKVLEEQIRPDLPWSPFKSEPSKDEFKQDKLGLKWCFIRVPKKQFYELKDEQLHLQLRPEILDSMTNSSLIIQRTKHFKYTASTKLSFKTSKENEEAGLAIYRTNENHFLLLKRKKELVLIKNFKGQKEEVARIPYNKSEVYLKAEANDLEVIFTFGETQNDMKIIGKPQDLVVIADGNGNQFNGPGIGMYATSNGKKSKLVAKFDWFEYKSE